MVDTGGHFCDVAGHAGLTALRPVASRPQTLGDNPQCSPTKILGFALVAALAFAMPVPTQADTYAPQAASQNFAGGAGGWSASTSYDGLCLPTLLCPTVTNSWTPRCRRQRLHPDAVRQRRRDPARHAVGVWQSPAFTYKGKKGHEPASVRLDLNMRSDLAALLGGTCSTTPATASTSWPRAGS